MPDSKKQYEVGYGVPPKSGQFQKGASGNPAGRPKRSKNFMTLLDQELEQQLTITENGQIRKITKREAMVKRLVTGALQGDARSLKNLLDIFRLTHRLRDEVLESPQEEAEGYDKIVARFLKRQMQEIGVDITAGKHGEADE